MKLHEFEVHDADAGTGGHRYPIAGRDRRIGRLPKYLARSAGCEERTLRHDGALRTSSRHERGADAYAALDQKLRRARVVDDADTRATADARPQKPGNFMSRSVTGVKHASDTVGRLASKGGASIDIAIERGAPIEQFLNVTRSLLHEDRDCGWHTESVTSSRRIARMQVR